MRPRYTGHGTTPPRGSRTRRSPSLAARRRVQRRHIDRPPPSTKWLFGVRRTAAITPPDAVWGSKFLERARTTRCRDSFNTEAVYTRFRENIERIIRELKISRNRYSFFFFSFKTETRGIHFRPSNATEPAPCFPCRNNPQ